MKHQRLFKLAAAVAVMILAACSPDGNMPSGQTTVEFTANILQNTGGTRVSGEYMDKWDGNEEIGVYMYKTILDDYQPNAHYRLTDADGKFSPVDVSDTFLYPKKGEAKFAAYYPWLANLYTTFRNVYPISVKDQTKNIDLMYAPGNVQGSRTVELNFTHQLSRLVLSVTHSDSDAVLEGIQTTITGLPTTAVFDLAAESPAVTGHGNVASITAKLVSTTGNTARVEAVVLANLDYTINFTLANGLVAKLPMPGKTFLPGRQYKYNIRLKDTTADVASEGIDGWGDGDEAGEDYSTTQVQHYPWVFKGRNLVTFGNSITSWDNSWARQINARLEFGNFYNGAVSGARWYRTTDTGADNCAIEHIQKYLAERDPARVPDFILLSYGTNDAADANTLGDPGTALQENDPGKLNLKTIAGALKWSLVTLRTNFPDAKIYVLLPLQRRNNDGGNDRNKIKIPVITAVCDGLSIPYFDCFNHSGITQANMDQYTSDGLHPNAAGQALHTDYIVRQLQDDNKRQ